MSASGGARGIMRRMKMRRKNKLTTFSIFSGTNRNRLNSLAHQLLILFTFTSYISKTCKSLSSNDDHAQTHMPVDLLYSLFPSFLSLNLFLISLHISISHSLTLKKPYIENTFSSFSFALCLNKLNFI